MELFDQHRDFVLDNVPKHIIVDSKISVNQAIPRGYDLSPLNIVCKVSHMIGDVGRSFAHHDEVMHGGVVIQAAGKCVFRANVTGDFAKA